jgi:adenine deaminase
MYLMIREGSSEKNLEALLPLVSDSTFHRCLFVSDDRSPHDLLHQGEMDAILRKAIALGLPPVRAIQMATINPATYFRLHGLGAVAPGYRADLVVLSDLDSVAVDMVFSRGRLLAQEGQALFPIPRPGPTPFTHTMNLKPLTPLSLRLPASKAHLPTIEMVPGQIITRRCQEPPLVQDDQVVADPARDLLKLVVAERYRASGEVGVALVKGFGLNRGALASSIAHDSHNIVAVGASDDDILLAIAEVARLQGGLVAAVDGRVMAALPLPLFGLLSPEPLETVSRGVEAVEAAARVLSAGGGLPAPLSALSFLALPVIPELRLTPRGLVDGATGELVG